MRRILGVSVDHAENTHVTLAVTPFVTRTGRTGRAAGMAWFVA
jgi:hypothetical protein